MSVLCLEMDKHAGEAERSSWFFAWFGRVTATHGCHSPATSPPSHLRQTLNGQPELDIMLPDLHIVCIMENNNVLYVIFWRLLDGLDLMSLIDQEGSGMLKNLG